MSTSMTTSIASIAPVQTPQESASGRVYLSFQHIFRPMSIHSSLKSANALVGQRSVLTRVERLAKLQKEDRFDPAKDSVWGLPKVRTKFKVAGGKKAEALQAEREEALEGGGEGGESPAPEEQ